MSWAADIGSSDYSSSDVEDTPLISEIAPVVASWDADSDEEKQEQPEAVVEEEEEEEPESKQNAPKKEAEPEPQPVERQMHMASPDGLRSPICVIMGHVDSGKTKLLDKIRRSNVQLGEAGGITQQIGATYVPVTTLKNMTKAFAQRFPLDYKLPGFLIIDTPGHESFSNLRSRGSSLCDIAILVVNITSGLEQQTLESINMLRSKKTPFIVALNKIDRISDWKGKENAPFPQTYKAQSAHAKDNFEKRLSAVLMEFQAEGLNAELYTKMPGLIQGNLTSIPVVPTSAVTGEGLPDLLMLVLLLTQKKMASRLLAKNELQCTVLEVKVESGIGTTLDVILVNGALHVGDKIVLSGMNGPITTHIRALLTPEPLKELRVKSQWVHHEVVYAAMGCKISAPNLTGAIAGSELYVCRNDEEVEEACEKLTNDLNSIFDSVDRSQAGVKVHASTLGSLEALISYLKDNEIPVSEVGIGPLYRKDVLSIAPNAVDKPEYAVILAFDVEINPEAQRYANENGVTIFQSPIIYKLTEMYEKYLKDLARAAKESARVAAIFPVKFEYLDKQLFNRSKPIIMGVRVLAGTLKKGTPVITTKTEKPLYIGTVDSMQINQQTVESANKGQEVAVCIKPPNDWTPIADKDFRPGEVFVSRFNRASIDLLKEHFRDELNREDWDIVVEVKKLLKII